MGAVQQSYFIQFAIYYYIATPPRRGLYIFYDLFQ